MTKGKQRIGREEHEKCVSVTTETRGASEAHMRDLVISGNLPENRPGLRLRWTWWLPLTVVICLVAADVIWQQSRLGIGSSRAEVQEQVSQELQPVPKSDDPSAGVREREKPRDAVNADHTAQKRPQNVPEDKQKATPSSEPARPAIERAESVRLEIQALEKEAIGIAEALVRDFPNRTDSLGLMGMVYNRLNQTSKAMEYWRKAMDLNPNRLDLYEAMATVALHKGEYEKAAEFCRQGLKKGDVPILHFRLAEALNGLGRAEESVNEIQVVIKAATRDPQVYCQLGKAYTLLHEHEKAKASYEMAVKLQPGNMVAQYGLAMACAKLELEDQYQRAMEEYQKLHAENMQAQRDRRDVSFDAKTYRAVLAMTCCDAATVYISAGSPEKAEPLLRRGVEVDSTNVGCRIKLVQFLCRMNRVAEGVPICKELIDIEPGNAIFRLRLAMLYARLERVDEAREPAKKAVELAPDNEECRRFLAQLESKR